MRRVERQGCQLGAGQLAASGGEGDSPAEGLVVDGDLHKDAGVRRHAGQRIARCWWSSKEDGHFSLDFLASPVLLMCPVA